MRSRVLITGATGGLGRAFVWEFAARGWDLVLTDRHGAPLDVLASGVARAHGVQVVSEPCDLADDTARTVFVDALADRGLRFGALVNVAGFDLEGEFLGRAWPGLLSLLRVNMEAGLQLTHAISGLRDRCQPLRVINTASLAAFFPMPYKALYAASKGFILSASLALREELRGRATITVLCPAGMPTTDACVEAIADQGLVGRLTTRNTSDVAKVTYRAAMRGRSVVVPGFINRAMLSVSRLLPRPLLAWLIGRRWGTVRADTYIAPQRPVEPSPALLAPMVPSGRIS